ncbi:MAG: hypothetical protein HYZ15_01530 [Sphingobacteriales bacterium]|nr:hypothetical protein [Sphingobacteriales bacterium]
MKIIFIQNSLFFFLGVMLMGSGCAQSSIDTPSPSDSTASSQPALSGRLFFHAYSCYTCNDSKLYRYDFAGHTLTTISQGWTMDNPMNVHLSPDGRSLVFMGVRAGSGWDVFRWRIGATTPPQNLTAAFGSTRDEDPKYSYDGNKIVFKQDGLMKEMDTLGNLLRTFAVAQPEASMPYYTKGDSILLYSGGEPSGTTADIYRVTLGSGLATALSAMPGVEEYYPVTRDDTSFYFTRWYSATNHNDQVYLGFLDGRLPQRLTFNETFQNYSDACPVSSRYLIVSSTTTGGKGGYDLYVVDTVSGKRWSLDLYFNGVNSAKNELGACYSD